jgi:hypothetical protein
MPALSSFFASDALIIPAWILLGTAIGIHALWGPKMSGRTKLGIAAYVIFGVLLIGISWWRGGIVNLGARGMLVVSVARRLGSEGSVRAYCAASL